MITSCPRETRSVPSASGESIAWPPGLSVIESTSILGSAASSLASARTLRASLRRDRATARDELRGDDEASRSFEGVAERAHRQASPSTSGVPYVWKLSIVFTPQYWPRARSAAVHVIGLKSGS